MKGVEDEGSVIPPKKEYKIQIKVKSIKRGEPILDKKLKEEK